MRAGIPGFSDSIKLLPEAASGRLVCHDHNDGAACGPLRNVGDSTESRVATYLEIAQAQEPRNSVRQYLRGFFGTFPEFFSCSGLARRILGIRKIICGDCRP